MILVGKGMHKGVVFDIGGISGMIQKRHFLTEVSLSCLRHKVDADKYVGFPLAGPEKIRHL